MDHNHGNRLFLLIVGSAPEFWQIDDGIGFLLAAVEFLDARVQGNPVPFELGGLLIGDGQQILVSSAREYGVQQLFFRLFNGFDF